MNLENFDWNLNFSLFLEYLLDQGDEQYKSFSKKITPGEFLMIGVRVPKLRVIAKEISKGNYRDFIKINVKDNIFEIMLLKALVISQVKNLDEYKRYFLEFLPQIDNWALCDIFISSSKIIKKDKSFFFDESEKLLKTNDEFKNRIAFVILLNYFASEEYLGKICELTNDFRSDDYYANMALGWLYSVLCIKMPERFKEALKTLSITPLVKRITFRKICDSYRVSDEDKNYFKTQLK